MRIGHHQLAGRVVLAPMAGVTDMPFRNLCRRLGAALAVSEMLTSDRSLWHTPKSRARLQHEGELGPVSVQIAGSDPAMLADAARANAEQGADIIDINMGCPAKKVCNVFAGSALLEDEVLVGRILDAVVAAVPVPVTLKIRTGPAPERRNGVAVARIAESAGIAALAVHGRTRACRFNGCAEFDTVRDIVQAVSIPVVANGDIDTPARAAEVLEQTGAAAVMIGRAAQGNPWIFGQVETFLATGRAPAAPAAKQIAAVLADHLDGLYALYGERAGVRIARKHLAWYCKGRSGAQAWWQRINRVECAHVQRALALELFEARTPLAEAA